MHYDPVEGYRMSLDRQREDRARADRVRLIRAAADEAGRSRRMPRRRIRRPPEVLAPIFATRVNLGIRDNH